MTAPVTRVFLVRHGATILSAEDRFAGATDVELSEEGREQTRRLAERLSGENILVVSHKATIRLLLSSLLGFDPRRYRDNLDQKPAALNIVDFRNPTRARLTLFNDTSHYDKASIPEIPKARLSKWWSTGA